MEHAKKLVTRAAEKVERTANKLGDAAQWTTIAAGYVAGRVVDKYKTGWEDFVEKYQETIGYKSEGEDEDENENSSKLHDTLVDIYPYLHLASNAYTDTSMAKILPKFVKRSHMISNVNQPSRLLGKITTDTQVHVCVIDEETVAFAFRGTELKGSTLGDILTDFHQRQAPVELYDASDNPLYRSPQSIRAHKGFQLALRDVTRSDRRSDNLRLVLEDMNMQASQVKRVVCIGHSLGGAIATLCAYWCRYVAFPNAQIKCITIGSPRVGNLEFAHDFNSNIVSHIYRGSRSYRVVNKGDIVPSLPNLYTYPRASSAYKHVSGAIYLSKQRIFTNEIIPREGSMRPTLINVGVTDHTCKEYINSINQILAIYYPHRHKLFV